MSLVSCSAKLSRRYADEQLGNSNLLPTLYSRKKGVLFAIQKHDIVTGFLWLPTAKQVLK
jgi:hypothetical protein